VPYQHRTLPDGAQLHRRSPHLLDFVKHGNYRPAPPSA
jgi:hypothetical protein